MMRWHRTVNAAKTRWLATALAVAIAGCSSSEEKKVDENLFPANYKVEILATMPQALADPTNVRDAFISEPRLMSVGPVSHYVVCIRYNARNNREYIGSRDRIAYFYAGSLNQLVDATREQCGNAAYKPFPELEKLCLAKKCE